jgi:hypothetical protein
MEGKGSLFTGSAICLLLIHACLACGCTEAMSWDTGTVQAKAHP